ncbi:transglutaminase family protein [Elioraea sp.]|jgi:transglutaminase-like putative cysteine protease|uniref:transglutaminase family protein n=1 Tax=Elioraea sp. TaxID=2185103 RepID=UPI0021DCB63B|nr:transglutaminase family protein [Elioraea sp.]GIX11923.1 MAG: transglutaminase [Elioraea sp.]
MTIVSIIHRTTYRYAGPVSFGPHRLMLRPRDSHDLRLLSATVAITPAASLRWKHDVFGNSVAVAQFATPADTLEIVSRITLEHFPADPPDVAALIEPYAGTHPFAYPAEEAEDLAPALRRHDPDPERRVDAWAKRFLDASGPTRTVELLEAMTRAIQAEFRYEARQAAGTRAAPETLRLGSGACRDLALLMMEACRSLGFAARFVSGYLYDAAMVDADRPMIGGGATHAWCQVYLPGAGWVEYDPTNGLIAGRNLIRVAVARTPEQAVPIAGWWAGDPAAYRGMEVSVEAEAGAAVPA